MERFRRMHQRQIQIFQIKCRGRWRGARLNRMVTARADDNEERERERERESCDATHSPTDWDGVNARLWWPTEFYTSGSDAARLSSTGLPCKNRVEEGKSDWVRDIHSKQERERGALRRYTPNASGRLSLSLFLAVSIAPSLSLSGWYTYYVVYVCRQVTPTVQVLKQPHHGRLLFFFRFAIRFLFLLRFWLL